MRVEMTSLLLNWMGMGVLLAKLFRLSYTFDLITNTQREQKRVIERLGHDRGIVMALRNLSL